MIRQANVQLTRIQNPHFQCWLLKCMCSQMITHKHCTNSCATGDFLQTNHEPQCFFVILLVLTSEWSVSVTKEQYASHETDVIRQDRHKIKSTSPSLRLFSHAPLFQEIQLLFEIYVHGCAYKVWSRSAKNKLRKWHKNCIFPDVAMTFKWV